MPRRLWIIDLCHFTPRMGSKGWIGLSEMEFPSRESNLAQAQIIGNDQERERNETEADKGRRQEENGRICVGKSWQPE